LKACEKRPVSLEQIRKLVSDIEIHLKNKDSVEITASLIGRLVMTRLKKLDKVEDGREKLKISILLLSF